MLCYQKTRIYHRDSKAKSGNDLRITQIMGSWPRGSRILYRNLEFFFPLLFTYSYLSTWVGLSLKLNLQSHISPQSTWVVGFKLVQNVLRNLNTTTDALECAQGLFENTKGSNSHSCRLRGITFSSFLVLFLATHFHPTSTATATLFNKKEK